VDAFSIVIIYIHLIVDIKLCLVRPIHSRVSIVCKQDRDEVRTSHVEKCFTLLDLQNQNRGLAREDEIACANMNWRKEKEIEREVAKALENKTKVDDPKGDIITFATKENMKPPSKRKRAAKNK
jgi:hypothetical protein